MNFDWLDGLTEDALAWGVTALGGLALIVAGFLLARIVRGGFAHALRRLGLQRELIDIISGAAYYLTVAVVVIAAFGVMGIETASLITILGTCTLAIGLALQGSLSNFASGVMLFTFRPFRKGDMIETGDFLGEVAEVGVFSTKLNSMQNVLVDIPNSYISQRPVLNWSRNGTVRLDLTLEVSIECDLEDVKNAIRSALGSEGRVLDDPKPFIGVENFGDNSAFVVVRPWCKTDDYWRLRFELPERIKDAIVKARGAMSTPRREVVLISSEPKPGTAESDKKGYGGIKK